MITRGAVPAVARAAAPLAGLLLAGLAACGPDRAPREGGGGAERGAAAPEPGGTAVIAESGDMDKPMPLLYEGGLDADLVDLLYMPLLATAWGDGRLVYRTSHDSPKALAWHHELVAPDSTVLRFHMRSGLHWSDGHPVTARDVVWTYRAAADPRVASPRQHQTAQLDSVVAESDSTVAFHFRRRYPEMLFDAALPIAPAHAWEDEDPSRLRLHRAFGRPEELVVSGPFRIDSRRAGEQVTLVPNPHFPQRPLLDRIAIRVIPETTTRIVELRTGTVDAARNVPFDQVAALREQAPNLRFETEEGRFWEYVAYNPRTVAAFADVEVRRALGMAVDVEGVIRALRMDDHAVPAHGPYPPIFRDFEDVGRPSGPGYDPEGARRILEERGWHDPRGTGIREKEGRPLRFTLLTNTGNQRRADVSLILQRQWREAGVDVRLQQAETVSFLQRLSRGEYEAALGSWGVGLNPDISPLWTPGSPYNIVHYDNAEVQALMERAAAARTAQEAVPLWRAAAERIVQDQPYTWLYAYGVVTARNERLRGMRVDTYGAYQNAWEWWIPAELRRPADRSPPSARAEPDTPQPPAAPPRTP